MKNINVNVEWKPDYDEGSLNQRIQDAIVDKVVKQYIETIDKSFKSKLDTMITDAVKIMIKDIKTIPLDTCDLEKGAVKKSMLLRDYIIQRAVDSLKLKTDEAGRSDSSAYNERRTPIEWVVKRHINDGDFSKAIQSEILRVQNEYKINLRNLVNDAIAPVYEQILLKLKSK
ncbi:MAG: hypothetical protein WC390_07155 [Sulfurimonas sp.]|jgi:hypothetical protein